MADIEQRLSRIEQAIDTIMAQLHSIDPGYQPDLSPQLQKLQQVVQTLDERTKALGSQSMVKSDVEQAIATALHKSERKIIPMVINGISDALLTPEVKSTITADAVARLKDEMQVSLNSASQSARVAKDVAVMQARASLLKLRGAASAALQS